MNQFANLFPVWVPLCGVPAVFQPAAFTRFSTDDTVWGLAAIRLGMGLTLSVEDFKQGWAAAERQTRLAAVSLDPLLPECLLPPDYLGREASQSSGPLATFCCQVARWFH